MGIMLAILIVTLSFISYELWQILARLRTKQSNEDVCMENGSEAVDLLYAEAVQLAKIQGKISSPMIQRTFSVGYARAARIIDQLEAHRMVGPQLGSNPRKLLID